MMGAGIPFGAEQRLLPEWIPLSFFAISLVCLPISWLLVFIQADNIASFQGGFGPVLATLHGFTIGVVLMTAFGASMQMLPVATGASMNNPKGVIALILLGGSGVAIILGGFSHYLPPVAAIGASLLLLGASLYTLLLVRLLVRAASLKLVRNHVFIGAFCLLVAALTGAAMIMDWAGFISFTYASAPLFHGGLALYGFMGLLVFGFSRIMVPMLSVSDKTNDKMAIIALGFSIIALLLWITGFFAYAPFAALIAAVLHIVEMQTILKGRIRTRLGPEWLVIRFSWLMLPIGILCALGAFWTDDIANFAQVTVFIAVVGWLVSFIIGILQRIVPFLLSMQIARRTGMPELPSNLSHEKLCKIMGPLHIAAVILGFIAILLEYGWLLRLSALLGFASGLLFLTFFIIAIKRKRISLEKMTT